MVDVVGRIERLAPLPPVLRPLLAGGVITSVGDGAWFTCWILFLTHGVGLSAAQAGIAFTAGGLAGVAGSTPIGHLADRWGAREVLAGLLVIESVATAAFLVASSLGSVIAVACVTLGASHARSGVKSSLVSRLTRGGEQAAALASLRVQRHAGFAAGAVVGAVAIQIDSRTAYDAVVVANAASFALYSAAVMRLPRAARTASGEGPRLPVLRDMPYLALAAICGVLALCWGMLSSGLPLWVADHTQAPRAMAAGVVVLNAIGIVALQVAVSRRVQAPAGAARAAIASGAWLALACLLFGAAAWPGAAIAAGLIALGGVAHLVGELYFVSASWGLSLPLMRAALSGQYQGLFATGEAAAITAAPLVMVGAVSSGGLGWPALAAVFLTVSVPAPAVTRWAVSTRSFPRARDTHGRAA